MNLREVLSDFVREKGKKDGDLRDSEGVAYGGKRKRLGRKKKK